VEWVEAEEGLDETVVSDREDDEDLLEQEVFCEAEETESPGDLFSGSGNRGNGEGLDQQEGLERDAGGSAGSGTDMAGHAPGEGIHQLEGEPAAFADDEGQGSAASEGSGDGALEAVLDEGGVTSPEKARVLAEAFNRSLAAMDRFYNQHLLIPAGKYPVGSRIPSRGERHEETVRLDAFYMGKFPVTNALFEVFVEKTGYRTTAERCGHGTVYVGRYLRRVDERTGKVTVSWSSALASRVVQGACWYQPSGPGSNLHNRRNHPVVQVSLEDALAFAAWTGKRLPTEAEWEAASRTEKGSRYPWGEEFIADACNLETSCIGDTSAVDRYLKFENPLGIVDALGNVQEWTSERAAGPDAGDTGRVCFVVKGGSWASGTRICLWSRMALDREAHSNILGFRTVAY
jgi:formylglycine-generating enzyme required for sulfatase activity